MKIKELLKPNRKEVIDIVEDREVIMGGGGGGDDDHQPELSLGPSRSVSSSSELSSAGFCRKRKHSAWDEAFSTQTGIDLQLNDPLPVDWEQCLDLQSGRMYYLNRKTLKKSWTRPREQKLDLELNISTLPNSEKMAQQTHATTAASHERCTNNRYSNNSSGGMVAVACLNCHLLVMLSKSSPSCPNCKYVHQLLSPQTIKPVKPLETLSLLH